MSLGVVQMGEDPGFKSRTNNFENEKIKIFRHLCTCPVFVHNGDQRQVIESMVEPFREG